ncbi:MAG: hypothetical protein M3308_01840 [Actinomycetota bacterium]|nr:hypothetical protein [Actinomycetota bacterium]
MAMRKLSLSMDPVAVFLAEQGAAREGISLSAWVSRLIRTAAPAGYPPAERDDQRLVQADEHDLQIIEANPRRAAG